MRKRGDRPGPLPPTKVIQKIFKVNDTQFSVHSEVSEAVYSATNQFCSHYGLTRGQLINQALYEFIKDYKPPNAITEEQRKFLLGRFINAITALRVRSEAYRVITVNEVLTDREKFGIKDGKLMRYILTALYNERLIRPLWRRSRKERYRAFEWTKYGRPIHRDSMESTRNRFGADASYIEYIHKIGPEEQDVLDYLAKTKAPKQDEDEKY